MGNGGSSASSGVSETTSSETVFAFWSWAVTSSEAAVRPVKALLLISANTRRSLKRMDVLEAVDIVEIGVGFAGPD